MTYIYISGCSEWAHSSEWVPPELWLPDVPVFQNQNKGTSAIISYYNNRHRPLEGPDLSTMCMLCCVVIAVFMTTRADEKLGCHDVISWHGRHVGSGLVAAPHCLQTCSVFTSVCLICDYFALFSESWSSVAVLWGATVPHISAFLLGGDQT